MTLSFWVPGLARPKGSKRAFAIRKKGVGYTGKVALVESAGPSLKAWEADIRAAAAKEMDGHALLEGPISVSLVFSLPKPKAPPKSRAVWPCGQRNDVDKLARSCLDAMTHRVWQDDGQVVTLVAEKVYGNPPGVRIKVETL